MAKNRKWIFLIFFGLGHFFTIAKADEVLYLEIVINGRNTTQISEVFHKGNDWEIAFKDLLKFGLQIDIPPKQRIFLSEIQGSQVIYDSEFQRLLITVPNIMLPMQYFGANIPDANSSSPRRDSGAFINYNLVTISGKQIGEASSLWHEAHFFNNDFFFVTNGMQQDQKTEFSPSGYTRFETYYQRDNEANLQSITVGDVINATPNWGRSIRLGGIRIARDYELNPAVITYPLPEFYGESALPGSVDLIINNQLRWRDQVTSGPFLINTIPYMSGAGVAQVVTTNPQGEQVQRAVDFYVTSDLLAQDMFDYDITFGFRRESFGLISNAYEDKPVISTSFRYGLNRYLTPQLLLQAGDGLRLGGAGLTFLAGPLGVFDIAGTASHYSNGSTVNEHGNQTSISYSYNYNRIGINANYIKRHGNYRDLGTQNSNVSGAPLNDARMQIALSIYSNQLGSFNFGYFRVVDNKNVASKALSFSWSQYYANDVSTFLNVSRTLFEKHENTLSFTISIPFGARGQASTSSQRDANGNWRNQLQAMSNAPYSGGFGWGVNMDDSAQKNRYAIVDWRTKYYDVSASAYRGGNQTQYTGTLNGALVFMDSNIYPTRFVTDSFAVVNTEHVNVPVMMGNQLVGKTNARGKLLVPDLASYLENRISIDPMLLPANAIVDSIEQLVTPRRKGGIHVQFPIVFSKSALAKVVTVNQQPLPAGAVLADRNSDKNYTAGWDGDLYIENLDSPLMLFWAEGECFIEVKPSADQTLALPRIGPFICQPVTEANQ